MKLFPITLIVFGIIIIIFPEIIAYLLGGLFIVIGINMLAFSSHFGQKNDASGNYVKFGNYKIYR